MPDRRTSLAAVVLLLAASSALHPQAIPAYPTNPEPAANTTPSKDSEVPEVPGLSSELHGLNAGITVAGIHDSVTGWATLITPALGYSFNRTFTIDVSLPIYFFRLAPTTAARPKPKDLLVKERGETGDLFLALHIQHPLGPLDYQLTPAVALPTRGPQNGLTTGRVSFDVANRFDWGLKRLSPNLELGMGDSNTLVNHVNTQNYTDLGPLAHFQIGLAAPLPFGASVESALYEQLPVGDQKTYGLSRNGKNTVVTGRRITEDNGFITTFDLPLDHHLTLSTFYNRSLRFHADAVSLGFTYILRAPPTQEEALTNLIREP